MIYVLIVMWFGGFTSNAGKSSLAIEFNTKEACHAAAKEIVKQTKDNAPIGTLICAEKGQR